MSPGVPAVSRNECGVKPGQNAVFYTYAKFEVFALFEVFVLFSKTLLFTKNVLFAFLLIQGKPEKVYTYKYSPFVYLCL